jgi:hypothetical protein
MINLERDRKVCPFCQSTAEPTHRVIISGCIVWCDRHKVLLVANPETFEPPPCEYPGCTERAEFAEMEHYPSQFSCRTHLGAASSGPLSVYGLTDRAITATEAWKEEHLAPMMARIRAEQRTP